MVETESTIHTRKFYCMLSAPNGYRFFVVAIRLSIIWWDTQDCYPYNG